MTPGSGCDPPSADGFTVKQREENDKNRKRSRNKHINKTVFVSTSLWLRIWPCIISKGTNLPVKVHRAWRRLFVNIQQCWLNKAAAGCGFSEEETKGKSVTAARKFKIQTAALENVLEKCSLYWICIITVRLALYQSLMYFNLEKANDLIKESNWEQKIKFIIVFPFTFSTRVQLLIFPFINELRK